MSAQFYIRLFTLLFFASTLQVASAQKKAATTKKSTSAKANTSRKAPVPVVAVIPEVPPPAPAPEPEYFPSDVLFLETGTPIFLESQVELDSKYLKEGILVCLYVKFPVKVQGRVVISAGREAWCRVNKLIRPKGNGRAGELEIEPMYVKGNDGQLITLTGNPVGAYGDDREILSQAVSLGGSAVGQQLMAVYQQRQTNRQLELDSRFAYQQQQQQEMQQRDQQLNMQAQYLQSQDLQSRQMQMLQQQQLMLQAQANPKKRVVVMPIAQEDVRYAMDPRSTYADYNQAPPRQQQQQPLGNGSVLGAVASPALMGVATALNIVSPFISILIKGKRAKLPKGYLMKTFVGYGVVMDGSEKW